MDSCVRNVCIVSLQQLWSVQNNFTGLVQERHNSIANALELRLSCINPSICTMADLYQAESLKIVRSIVDSRADLSLQ